MYVIGKDSVSDCIWSAIGGKQEVIARRLSEWWWESVALEKLLVTSVCFLVRRGSAQGFCGEWHMFSQMPPPAANTPPFFDDRLETGRCSLTMGRDRDWVVFDMNYGWLKKEALMLVQQGMNPEPWYTHPQSVSQWAPLRRSLLFFFNKLGGREMKRDPPTGMKCLPWESFGSDRVMTYLTTENKQQLYCRRGHNGVDDGSPACYPLGSPSLQPLGSEFACKVPFRGCF